jgi:hypothetical protein
MVGKTHRWLFLRFVGRYCRYLAGGTPFMLVVAVSLEIVARLRCAESL